MLAVASGAIILGFSVHVEPAALRLAENEGVDIRQYNIIYNIIEDVQKALSLVEKTQPVPDKYKAGFEAISARETLAMLEFLSSDWMEGRETATRGYQMAADYAASMFKLWGIKPGGDMPMTGFGGARGMGGQRGGAPAAPPRYEVLLRYGAHLEPWVAEVRPLP